MGKKVNTFEYYLGLCVNTYLEKNKNVAIRKLILVRSNYYKILRTCSLLNNYYMS